MAAAGGSPGSGAPDCTRAAVAEFAPAKINLALHVTGRRDDGYHRLDTLVAFADIGDRLTVTPSETLDLRITGPFASALPAPRDDLVLKAAAALRAEAFGGAATAPGAAMVLHKVLPIASGLGGGSADAAAALRALNRRWQLDWPDERLAGIGLRLGADVPMCLASRPLRAQGIGERITTLDTLPDFGLVLVNPGTAVSTPAVFRALAGRFSPPLPEPPVFADVAGLVRYLGETANDLEAPALTLAPDIAAALDALRRTDACLMARMSGSGATCFAVYPDVAAARAGAGAVLERHPEWWVAAGRPHARDA